MIKDVGSTILQSFISVAILYSLTRIMGKKQMSHLTFFNYVAGISIGSIAASFAVDPLVDYARGITALLVYAIFPITLSYISMKSYKGRKLLDGTPMILIQNGNIIEGNLKKTKLNVNDLLEECRLKNAFNISEIEFAILETSGELSLMLKPPFQPVTPLDMNIPTSYKGLFTNLIIDGMVMDEHLLILGKDRNWLMGELGRQNVTNAEDVLLACVDALGQMNVYLKRHDPPVVPLM